MALPSLTPCKGEMDRWNINIKRISFSMDASSVFLKDDCTIQVCARLKPLPENQLASHFHKKDKNTLCYIKRNLEEQEELCYTFNHVFDSDTDQQTLYKKIIEPKVERFLRGENVLIFSYGSTGSGKTYTIQGTPANPGIIPRSLLQIFKSLHENIVEDMFLCPNKSTSLTKLSEEQLSTMITNKEEILDFFIKTVKTTDKSELNSLFDNKFLKDLLVSLNQETSCLNAETIDTKYSLWVSYVEIYNDNIYDLLDISCEEGSRKPLKIGCDLDKANYIKDLGYYMVSSWGEAWKLYLCGRNRLHMTATKFNQSSSRSHSIFDLRLVKENSLGCYSNSFSICDLAGAESQRKVHHQGFRLRETVNINTSLMVLNRCFKIIRENQLKPVKKLVPYRDSKLTQIFKKALLSSNSIVMITNISHSLELLEDTEQTLRMSAIAREIIVKKKKPCYRNPTKKFSLFCSAPPGVPVDRVIFEDGQKEDNIEDDPKVLREIIKNLEERMKSQEMLHQCNIEEMKEKLNQAEEALTSLKLSFESNDTEDTECTFLEIKRKRFGEMNTLMVTNSDYRELVEKISETKQQLIKKCKECDSLRTQLMSVQYQLSMRNKNTVLEDIIMKLENNDTAAALLDVLNEKTNLEKKNKIYEELLEDAKKEFFYFEEKLDAKENQLTQKVLENEYLREELADRDEVILRYTELIAKLHEEHGEEKMKFMKQNNDLVKSGLAKSPKLKPRKSRSLSPVTSPKSTRKTQSSSRKINLRNRSPANRKTPVKTTQSDDSDKEYKPRTVQKSVKRTARKKKEAPEYVENLPDDKQASNLLQVPGTSRMTRSATNSRKLFVGDVDDVSGDFFDLKITSPSCSPSTELKRHQK